MIQPRLFIHLIGYFGMVLELTDDLNEIKADFVNGLVQVDSATDNVDFDSEILDYRCLNFDAGLESVGSENLDY